MIFNRKPDKKVFKCSTLFALLVLCFPLNSLATENEYGNDGLETTGDINLEDFSFTAQKDFGGSSHINPGTGELLYRRPLFKVPGRSGFQLVVELNYVSSVSQKGINKRNVSIDSDFAINLGPAPGSSPEDLIYTNHGPQWILSVNGIAVQILNFEKNAYHLDNDNNQISIGDEVSHMVIGYHWSNSNSINPLRNQLTDPPTNEFLQFLKGEGGLFQMKSYNYYTPFQTHQKFISNAKGEKVKPIGFISGTIGSRVFALKPGDGTTTLYNEEVLAFEGGLEGCYGTGEPCEEPLLLPRTFYPMEINDRFNNKIVFEYNDNVAGYGRKNLTKIIFDFESASALDDYVIDINYVRQNDNISEITITDAQQTFGLHGLTSNEYDAAKDKFMVDRITWTGNNVPMADTEFTYDLSVHQMRANPIQCGTPSNAGPILNRILTDTDGVTTSQNIPCTFVYDHPAISQITYPSGKIEDFSYVQEYLLAAYQSDCSLSEMQQGVCTDCELADLCLNNYTIGAADRYYQQGYSPLLRYPLTQNQTHKLGALGHEQFHRRLVKRRYSHSPMPNSYHSVYETFDYTVTNNPVFAGGTNYHLLEKQTTVRTFDYLNYLSEQDAPSKTVVYTYQTRALKPYSNINYHTFLTDKKIYEGYINEVPLVHNIYTYDGIDLSQTSSAPHNWSGTLAENHVVTTFGDGYGHAESWVYNDDSMAHTNARNITKLDIFNENARLIPECNSDSCYQNAIYIANLPVTSRVFHSDNEALPASREIISSYNEDFLLQDEFSPIGDFHHSYAYTNGTLTRTTDVLAGISTHFSYTTPGTQELLRQRFPTQITYGQGTLDEEVVYKDYDVYGNVIYQTNAAGDATTFSYDGFGRPLTMTKPGDENDTITYTYQHCSDDCDAYALIITKTQRIDADIESKTEYIYDNDMNLTTIKNFDTNNNLLAVTSQKHDYQGNLIQNTDALGNQTDYAYNILNQKTQITWADGESQTFRYLYDEFYCSHTTEKTDEMGNVNTDCFGPTQLLLKTETGLNTSQASTTSYVYDDLENLISYETPTGQPASFTYNTAGKHTSSFSVDTGKTSYLYYGDLLKMSKTANGIFRCYVHDALGRVIGEKTAHSDDDEEWPSALLVPELCNSNESNDIFHLQKSFTYHDGQMSSATNHKSHTSNAYTYDNRERLVEETISSSYFWIQGDINNDGTVNVVDVVNQVHAVLFHAPYAQDNDLNNDGAVNVIDILQVVDIVLGHFPPAHHSVQYAYNSADLIQQITYPNDLLVEYYYDERGRVTQVTFLNEAITLGYDANNKLIQETFSNGIAFDHSFNSRGLPVETISQCNNPSSQSSGCEDPFAEAYEYLPNGLLQAVFSNNLPRSSYGYDHKGQLVLEQYHDVSGHQNVYHYTYDRVGNITQTMITDQDGTNEVLTDFEYQSPADASPNILSNQLVRYGDVTSEYDELGNLTAEEKNNNLFSYIYDNQNHLLEVHKSDQIQPLYRFAYDAHGQRIASEGTTTPSHKTFYVQSNGKTLAEYQGTELRYNYVYVGDQLIARVAPVAEDPSSFNIEFYHTDHLGSTRRISDTNGNWVWGADYFAFGGIREQYGETENQWCFIGGELSTETASTHFGARHLSHDTRRFTQVDPLWWQFPSTSAYVYGYNNPLRYTDPSGKYPEAESKSENLVDDILSKPQDNAERFSEGITGFDTHEIEHGVPLEDEIELVSDWKDLLIDTAIFHRSIKDLVENLYRLMRLVERTEERFDSAAE